MRRTENIPYSFEMTTLCTCERGGGRGDLRKEVGVGGGGAAVGSSSKYLAKVVSNVSGRAWQQAAEGTERGEGGEEGERNKGEWICVGEKGGGEEVAEEEEGDTRGDEHQMRWILLFGSNDSRRGYRGYLAARHRIDTTKSGRGGTVHAAVRRVSPRRSCAFSA